MKTEMPIFTDHPIIAIIHIFAIDFPVLLAAGFEKWYNPGKKDEFLRVSVSCSEVSKRKEAFVRLRIVLLR